MDLDEFAWRVHGGAKYELSSDSDSSNGMSSFDDEYFINQPPLELLDDECLVVCKPVQTVSTKKKPRKSRCNKKVGSKPIVSKVVTNTNKHTTTNLTNDVIKNTKHAQQKGVLSAIVDPGRIILSRSKKKSKSKRYFQKCNPLVRHSDTGSGRAPTYNIDSYSEFPAISQWSNKPGSSNHYSNSTGETSTVHSNTYSPSFLEFLDSFVHKNNSNRHNVIHPNSNTSFRSPVINDVGDYTHLHKSHGFQTTPVIGSNVVPDVLHVIPNKFSSLYINPARAPTYNSGIYLQLPTLPGPSKEKNFTDRYSKGVEVLSIHSGTSSTSLLIDNSTKQSYDSFYNTYHPDISASLFPNNIGSSIRENEPYSSHHTLNTDLIKAPEVFCTNVANLIKIQETNERAQGFNSMMVNQSLQNNNSHNAQTYHRRPYIEFLSHPEQMKNATFSNYYSQNAIEASGTSRSTLLKFPENSNQSYNTGLSNMHYRNLSSTLLDTSATDNREASMQTYQSQASKKMSFAGNNVQPDMSYATGAAKSTPKIKDKPVNLNTSVVQPDREMLPKRTRKRRRPKKKPIKKTELQCDSENKKNYDSRASVLLKTSVKKGIAITLSSEIGKAKENCKDINALLANPDRAPTYSNSIPEQTKKENVSNCISKNIDVPIMHPGTSSAAFSEALEKIALPNSNLHKTDLKVYPNIFRTSEINNIDTSIHISESNGSQNTTITKQCEMLPPSATKFEIKTKYKPVDVNSLMFNADRETIPQEKRKKPKKMHALKTEHPKQPFQNISSSRASANNSDKFSEYPGVSEVIEARDIVNSDRKDIEDPAVHCSTSSTTTLELLDHLVQLGSNNLHATHHSGVSRTVFSSSATSDVTNAIKDKALKEKPEDSFNPDRVSLPQGCKKKRSFIKKCYKKIDLLKLQLKDEYSSICDNTSQSEDDHCSICDCNDLLEMESVHNNNLAGNLCINHKKILSKSKKKPLKKMCVLQ